MNDIDRHSATNTNHSIMPDKLVYAHRNCFAVRLMSWSLSLLYVGVGLMPFFCYLPSFSGSFARP